MELALEPNATVLFILVKISFNPCFNGTCFRTYQIRTDRAYFFVSILVLMELALERCVVIPCMEGIAVSILVLMELALEQIQLFLRLSTLIVSILVLMELALERCSTSLIDIVESVSILVLMELALEQL